MTRCTWLLRGLAIVGLGLPLLIAQAGAASADHRHRGGDRHDHWRGHDGWDRGWRGDHWSHRRHGHRYHGHRHHGSGISGLFIWNMTPPPPPPRYVVVEPPPPIIVQRPPVYMQAPRAQSYCREYTTTTFVNGRPAEAYGTACLQPDGSWRIVSMN